MLFKLFVKIISMVLHPVGPVRYYTAIV